MEWTPPPDGIAMWQGGVRFASWAAFCLSKSQASARRSSDWRRNPALARAKTKRRLAGPALLHSHGVASGISVIVEGKGRAFGVLDAHTGSFRQFSVQDTSFIQAVADLLGQAIVRLGAEKGLHESEAKFRNLIEGSIQGVWIDRRLDQPVLFANQAFADMRGSRGTEHSNPNPSMFAFSSPR